MCDAPSLDKNMRIKTLSREDIMQLNKMNSKRFIKEKL